MIKHKRKKLTRSKKNQAQIGFTLIELLVTISIIGFIASGVMYSLQGVRELARDTVRVDSMRKIRDALEMYYIDHDAYPSTGLTWQSNCDTPPNWDYIPGLAPDYMPVLPSDPYNCKPAKYSAEILGFGYISDGQNYNLAAHPETQNPRFKFFWSCDTVNDKPHHYNIASPGWTICPTIP